MSINKDLLIEWIHRAEFDFEANKPKKRLNSLVSELFFVKTLPSSSELNLPEVLVTGWCCSGLKNKKWYKFSSKDCIEARKISNRFIRERMNSSPRDKFFFIEYKVNKLSCSPWLEIIYSISEVKISNESKMLFLETNEESTAFTCNVNDKIKRELSNRSISSVKEDIKGWLFLITMEELERLLAVRFFMNFCGCYMTDIDAIAVDKNNKITFIEFKRKTPAIGRKYSLINKSDMSSYVDEILELKKMKPDDQKKSLADHSKWSVSCKPAFGLDTSHVNNVQTARSQGWNYIYVIWNKQPSHPNELFRKGFFPVDDWIELYLMNVQENNCFGITMTYGEDSGSHTTNVRYQVTFDSENFYCIKVSSASLKLPTIDSDNCF